MATDAEHASGSPPRAAGDTRTETGGLDAFLRDLQRRVRPPQTPTALAGSHADLRAVAAGADLVARFQAEAAEAGCSVHVATAADWAATVVQIVRAAGARHVLVSSGDGPLLTAPQAAALGQRLAEAGVGVTASLDDETLFGVDAAITGVAAAIAETGTIVCTSGPGLARGASLIPPVHVVVVAAAQLVPDLLDYFAGLPTDDLPANVNLISGPSKTADIEGILITGVHGPGTVHVVLVADA